MKHAEDWKIWDESNAYGETFYKRATGELDEMESSKAICEVLRPYYKTGLTLADIGCGAGHYLRSLRSRVDPKIQYTGVDATSHYVELAQKAFPDSRFVVGDVRNLQFEDKSFDIVMCNNVLLHLPPPPSDALCELLRITKNILIVRMVFGERNYVIKEVREAGESDSIKAQGASRLFGSDGCPLSYNYFNMYTESFIKEIISSMVSDLKVQIVSDTWWEPFDNTLIEGQTGTKVQNGKQVSGNLILDWRFVIIERL